MKGVHLDKTEQIELTMEATENNYSIWESFSTQRASVGYRFFMKSHNVSLEPVLVLEQTATKMAHFPTVGMHRANVHLELQKSKKKPLEQSDLKKYCIFNSNMTKSESIEAG